MTTRPWNIAATEVQLATWREALIANDGNISHAAKDAGVSRSHATRLMKKYELVEFAAELRIKAGMLPAADGERKGVVAGRPRK